MDQKRILHLSTPGDHPPDVRVEEIKPVGRCDGVVWLGGGKRAIEEADGTIRIEVIDGKLCEKEAMRYLHPMPALWRALNPGMIGVGRPHGIEVMFTNEMFEMERTQGRKLEWLFAYDEHGVYAAHPRYRVPHKCWTLVKLAEGIWGFLFEEPLVSNGQPKPIEPLMPAPASAAIAWVKNDAAAPAAVEAEVTTE